MCGKYGEKNMRRIIRHFILLLGAIVRHNTAPKVLFYHDIGRDNSNTGTPQEVFWAHMRKLRPNDVVCFDDGFRGVWDEKEKFVSAKIKPIIFVAVRLVGTPGYLTWEELKILQDRYGFSIQSHTWTHQTLVGPEIPSSPHANRTDEWYNTELWKSRLEIEGRLGRSVKSLCFPGGYFSDNVIERCRLAGYEKLYASYPGEVSDSYIQPRCICQDLSSIEFSLVLSGGMNLLADFYKKRHKAT